MTQKNNRLCNPIFATVRQSTEFSTSRTICVIEVNVMQERRQLALSVPGDGFSYAGLRL
jgi:hypothetical protein